MKIILFTTILALTLFASNPKVYSALGDKLYNNLEKIGSLEQNKNFKSDDDIIKEYIFSVKALKEIGFNIDKGNFSVSKKEYLTSLRELSKTNDYFVIKVKKLFLDSIDKEDSELFISMIKTGLLDINRYKSKIKNYYYTHKDEIDIKDTIIEEFLAEEQKKSKKPAVYKGLTKEELHKANIERIRAKDKARHEAMQKALEEELREKKMLIREQQIKELRTK